MKRGGKILLCSAGVLAGADPLRFRKGLSLPGPAQLDWRASASGRRVRVEHAAGRGGGGQRRAQRRLFRWERPLPSACQTHALFQRSVRGGRALRRALRQSQCCRCNYRRSVGFRGRNVCSGGYHGSRSWRDQPGYLADLLGTAADHGPSLDILSARSWWRTAADGAIRGAVARTAL